MDANQDTLESLPPPNEPQHEPVNFGNWSDATAGCFQYYSHWYSPSISLCDTYDDESRVSDTGSGSMVTIYTKGAELGNGVINQKLGKSDSFSYSDSQNSVSSKQHSFHWCVTGCCRALGCFRV